MQRKLVLFDFDGVIANSLTAALKTVSALEPELSHHEYLRRHEGNIYESEQQLQHRPMQDLDWWKEYRNHAPSVELCSGMKEVVEELPAQYPLFIISSTISEIIEEQLQSFGLLERFTKIMGADVHRSKVVKMNMLLEEYAVQPKDCVFVTDTLGDLREAAKVGIRCVAVSWGYHDIATLEKGSSEAILLSPHELSAKVTNLLAE